MSKLPQPTLTEIMNVVCDYYSIEPADVYAEGRQQPAAKARQIIMFLLFELCRVKRATIASLFNRDWSAVQQAIKKMSYELTTNSKLRKEIIYLAEQVSRRAINRNKQPI